MPTELLEPVFYFIGYWTGKLIVRVVSLGRLHVSFTLEPERNDKRGRRWNAATFMRDKKRYVKSDVVTSIGMIAWAVAIAAIIVIAKVW